LIDEDDHLLEARHLHAFIRQSEILAGYDSRFIPGFTRWEYNKTVHLLHTNMYKRDSIDVPDAAKAGLERVIFECPLKDFKVRRLHTTQGPSKYVFPGHIYAGCTHQGFWMLTQDQLRSADNDCAYLEMPKRIDPQMYREYASSLQLYKQVRISTCILLV
jgi:hypothetical protein